MVPTIAFENLIESRFVDRPNQFLVRCRLASGRLVRAFLPNPGRMWELLFPGVSLYLTEESPAAGGQSRRTRFTAIAVEREGELVFLHTHLTNLVARSLIEAGRVPALADAELVDSEVVVGRSRFDFLLNRGGRDLYLEVKSCTLYGNRVAMFPDAVTARGRKHLLELAELSRRGTPTAVLFVVHSGRVDFFMPDYHSDLAFSQSLLQVRDKVAVSAIAVSWSFDPSKREFALAREARQLAIPWEFLDREVADCGSYLLLLQLVRRRRLNVGQLGSIAFPRGWYVYVGSAMANLAARLARHGRRRKRFHWHVDYLRDVADSVVPVPIRSSRRLECQLSGALASSFEGPVKGFGSSDCGCATHLYYSATAPLDRRDFHELLQSFRMPGERCLLP